MLPCSVFFLDTGPRRDLVVPADWGGGFANISAYADIAHDESTQSSLSDHSGGGGGGIGEKEGIKGCEGGEGGDAGISSCSYYESGNN